MIIKPKPKRNFILIPNELVDDRRLSIETRGMLVHLLAKPLSWQPRLAALARALARDGEHLGRKKLTRMIREAMSAGYMLRLPQQSHRKNGCWGPVLYVVGMPKDVAALMRPYQHDARSGRKAHAPEARAREGVT